MSKISPIEFAKSLRAVADKIEKCELNPGRNATFNDDGSPCCAFGHALEPILPPDFPHEERSVLGNFGAVRTWVDFDVDGNYGVFRQAMCDVISKNDLGYTNSDLANSLRALAEVFEKAV